MRILSKRTVHKIVHHIELQDLAEYEADDECNAEYARGVARGLRIALELIDKGSVPTQAIIKREGIGISFEQYEEDEWISIKSHQMNDQSLSNSM